MYDNNIPARVSNDEQFIREPHWPVATVSKMIKPHVKITGKGYISCQRDCTSASIVTRIPTRRFGNQTLLGYAYDTMRTEVPSSAGTVRK